MIEVKQRRLNARYYGHYVTYRTTVTFDRSVVCSQPGNTLQRWIDEVRNAAFTFNRLCCEGIILITVPGKVGYTTQGNLFVFDDPTLAVMQPFVQRLYDALGSRPQHFNYRVDLRIHIKVEKVYLLKEEVWVPFCDLDTEPREEPTRHSQVTVHTPLLN
jgi:hypothetical protein